MATNRHRHHRGRKPVEPAQAAADDEAAHHLGLLPRSIIHHHDGQRDDAVDDGAPVERLDRVCRREVECRRRPTAAKAMMP